MAIPTVYISANAELIEEQAEPIDLDYIEITAPGDRVSIVARGTTRLRKGDRYGNVHRRLFTCRVSKICNVKKLFGTLVVPEVSGGHVAPHERAERHLRAFIQENRYRA